MLTLGACAAEPETPTESEPIKVGVLASRSGVYSAYGLGAEAGIKLVVDDINANGGIESLGGAKIELVVADTASDPATAASEARRLIDQENVSVILGPSTTPEAQAVVGVTEKEGVPTVGLETTSVFGENYFYIVSVLAASLGESYAEFVDFINTTTDENIKDIVITFPQNDYGQQNADAAEKKAKELGYNVLEVIAVDPKIEDYTPTLLKIRDLDPDAVISILYSRDGPLFHDARYALGYNEPIFVCGVGGCDSPAIWEGLDPAVAKATLANRLFSESLLNPDAKLPGLQKLLADAEGVVDVPLDQHFLMGAQGARVVQAVLEKAASSDREVINDSFEKFEIPAGSDYHYMPGAVDGIKYKDGSIVGAKAMFNQWTSDGKLELLYPEDVAVAKPITKPRP
ncbi:ABC transporter substrate-binding protein [soil metagenome]